MMNRAYLLLGSNLDNRLALLESAKDLIGRHIGPVLSSSSVYESEPWGFHSDSHFLNQVVIIGTSLGPPELLQGIKDIEEALGRKRARTTTYSSRRIDIDILFYNDSVIQLQDLVIPHPRIQERRFVLVPLCEINGYYMHPGIKKTLKQLLSECEDQGKVLPYIQVPGKMEVK